MHEAKMHRYNSFITLTYNNENLPETGSLVKGHITTFLNTLRKALVRGSGAFLTATTSDTAARRYGAPPHAPNRVRFYMAGEYGERFARPHYHLCLFGIDFSDKKYLQLSPAGSKLYRSPTLERLWNKGFTTVGELTYESAAYTARYVMKKITGRQAKQHYEKIDPETGEIIQLLPEYNNMSRRPGIGKPWLEKFCSDAYPHGKVIIKGRRVNTPRYYDQQYAKIEPLKAEDLAYGRFIEALAHYQDNTNERLAARRRVHEAQAKQLLS